MNGMQGQIMPPHENVTAHWWLQRRQQKKQHPSLGLQVISVLSLTCLKSRQAKQRQPKPAFVKEQPDCVLARRQRISTSQQAAQPEAHLHTDHYHVHVGNHKAQRNGLKLHK